MSLLDLLLAPPPPIAELSASAFIVHRRVLGSSVPSPHNHIAQVTTDDALLIPSKKPKLKPATRAFSGTPKSRARKPVAKRTRVICVPTKPKYLESASPITITQELATLSSSATGDATLITGTSATVLNYSIEPMLSASQPLSQKLLQREEAADDWDYPDDQSDDVIVPVSADLPTPALGLTIPRHLPKFGARSTGESSVVIAPFVFLY
eukprot:TRINITY_DN15569_c0_g1_i1.p2 TRINITY_DN15569_c0_g1~~TRINITY_DN15569_c0_g1_i1.p2  ORF type:complete len:209 (-),score=28.98 TRINITY_DN15569_c0_g1_i1:960-1586(-)